MLNPLYRIEDREHARYNNLKTLDQAFYTPHMQETLFHNPPKLQFVKNICMSNSK